jgi:hypothetical protein
MESSNTLLSNSQNLHSLVRFAIMLVTSPRQQTFYKQGDSALLQNFQARSGTQQASNSQTTYQKPFPRGYNEADHSPPHLKPRLRIKAENIHTTPTCLHGVWEIIPPWNLFCTHPVIFCGNTTALKEVFTIPRTLVCGKCKENFLVIIM